MNDQTSATKGDIQDLKALIQHTNTRFHWLHEDIDRVLGAIFSMDKRLTGKVDDHEKRITNLEKTIA